MCVNIADPTQLSGMGGSYVKDKMVSFHILNSDWAKEISFVNYILPGPGVYTV
jgi:hypothetical protein